MSEAMVDMRRVDTIARKVRALKPEDVARRLANELTLLDADDETRERMLAKWDNETRGGSK